MTVTTGTGTNTNALDNTHGAVIRPIARHELRYLTTLPGPVIAYLLMPVVMMLFLRPSFEIILRRFGYPSANGAELVVPAQAALFSFFLAAHYGLFLFNEHGWGVWDRLRGSSVPMGKVMLAKGGVQLAHQTIQFLVLIFVVGSALGLRVGGSAVAIVAVVMVSVATALVTVAFSGVVAVLSPNQAILDACCYGGGIAFAALGGGIAPYWLLPEWVQPIAPASPIYWTIKGFRQALLDDASLGAVAGTCGVLLAIAATMLAIAVWRFDPAAVKQPRVR